MDTLKVEFNVNKKQHSAEIPLFSNYNEVYIWLTDIFNEDEHKADTCITILLNQAIKNVFLNSARSFLYKNGNTKNPLTPENIFNAFQKLLSENSTKTDMKDFLELQEQIVTDNFSTLDSDSYKDAMRAMVLGNYKLATRILSTLTDLTKSD